MLKMVFIFLWRQRAALAQGADLFLGAVAGRALIEKRFCLASMVCNVRPSYAELSDDGILPACCSPTLGANNGKPTGALIGVAKTTCNIKE